MSANLSPDRLSLVPTALLLIGFPLLPVFSDWAMAILTLAAMLGCVLRWRNGRQNTIKPFVGGTFPAFKIDRVRVSTGFTRRKWSLRIDEETMLFEPTASAFDLINFRPVTRQDFFAIPRLDVLDVRPKGQDSIEVVYRPEGQLTQTVTIRSREACADIVLILQPDRAVKTGAIL